MKQIMSCLLVVLALLSACKQSPAGAVVTGADAAPAASLLTLEDRAGYTLVTIENPWGEGVLRRYALVPRESDVPDGLPDGTTIVRTPVDRALVYSVVHTGALKDVGAGDAIAGVADAQFFTDPDIRRAVAQGTIADCGSSMAPDIERVIALNPDAVILDTYQSANYGQITKLDVPVIECADYMETTPLGRAEWIKFYGALVGKRADADSLYAAVVKNYNGIKRLRAATPQRPRVLTETVISGIWNVPGGGSYMAALIADAGGDYPWRDTKSAGSLNLDIDQVLATAQDADVWIIKSFNIHNLDDLRASSALNTEFKAFKTGNVYVCDTNTSRLYEMFPFHPDRLLQEYSAIFDGKTDELQFFTRITR